MERVIWLPKKRMNMIINKYTFPIVICFFSVVSAFAQQQDFAGIATVAIEKNVGKGLSFELSAQAFQNQNLRETGYFFGDVGANFRITRNFSLGVHYRFMELRNLDNFYDDRQIWYGEVNWSKRFNRLGLQFRSRYQTSVYGLNYADPYKPNKNYWRNRLGIRYRLDYYWQPFISSEWFYRMDKCELDNFRHIAGMQYRFNEDWSVSLYYQNDWNINRFRNNITHSIGCTISIDL